MNVLVAVAALLVAQPSPPPASAPAPKPIAAAEETASVRESAASARRAAEAAEKAAAAAERSAKAVEEIAQRLSASAAVVTPAPVPPVAPAPAPATGLATSNKWDGTIGLSLIALAGNAETLTVSGTAAFDRKLDPWTLSTRLLAAYGQSRLAESTESAVVAMLASAQVRADRKVSNWASAFAQVGVDTDHVKSLEYRALGEAGAAITWLERKEGEDTRLLLRTDLALRYSHESRFQYYPTPRNVDDLTLVAPKLGVGFRYALNENVAFYEEAEVLTNIVGAARLVGASTTRLSAKLTAQFAFSTGLQLAYDSAPAPGKKRLDSVLSLGVDYTF